MPDRGSSFGIEVTDFNGAGRWTRHAIIGRYAARAAELGIVPRDVSPREYFDRGRRLICPAMEKIIEGIEAGDPACIEIGIEFIEEDAKFPFGKILKSNTARALRRAPLSDPHRKRIRCRVLGMLRRGNVPHEFGEYAKLVRKIGLRESEIGDVPGTSERVSRFSRYLRAAATPGTKDALERA